MSQLMREKILALATDLFMKQGYLSTSTRQIARILGITQPALYHHFKNKEKLYTEVFLKFAQEIGQDLMEILERQLSPIDSLFQMSLVLKEKHPMNFAMMMHDLKTELSHETQLEIFNIWFENYYSPFNSIFELLKDDLIEGYQPEAVAKHFLRTISSYVTNEQQYIRETPLDLDTIINIFIRGITR